MDLRNRYWKELLNPEVKPKTAFSPTISYWKNQLSHSVPLVWATPFPPPHINRSILIFYSTTWAICSMSSGRQVSPQTPRKPQEISFEVGQGAISGLLTWHGLWLFGDNRILQYSINVCSNFFLCSFSLLSWKGLTDQVRWMESAKQPFQALKHAHTILLSWETLTLGEVLETESASSQGNNNKSCAFKDSIQLNKNMH